MTALRAGDLVHVTRAASVQFHRPIVFRVIRVVDDWTRTAYDGWVWLDGYVLDARGEAVERRSIFVQPSGLRRLAEPPRPRRAPRTTTRA